VIADMAMPGLDGPQLIAKIKDVSPHTPAIPHLKQSSNLTITIRKQMFF
jgi:CheY-like chemotaxis protein